MLDTRCIEIRRWKEASRERRTQQNHSTKHNFDTKVHSPPAENAFETAKFGKLRRARPHHDTSAFRAVVTSAYGARAPPDTIEWQALASPACLHHLWGSAFGVEVFLELKFRVEGGGRSVKGVDE